MSRTSELPKHLFDTAMEIPRAAAAFFSLAADNLTTREKPIGQGRPVLVLPGIGTGDLTTVPLRRYLKARGFAVYGWGDGGISRGLTDGEFDRLRKRLDYITDRHAEKVGGVGWSLGGMLINDGSQLFTKKINCTVTLGSPHFVGMMPDDGVIPGLHRLYELLNGEPPSPKYFSMLVEQSPVPTTSIFSLSDGVVDGRACIRPGNHHTQNIELRDVSHCGLGLHPMAFRIVADRLAHPQGQWSPYKVPENGRCREHLDIPVPAPDEIERAIGNYFKRHPSSAAHLAAA